MTDELPPGWSRAPLADVGTWGSGGTPSRSDAKAYGGDIPWLKIGDLPDGPVVSAEERITKHGLAVSAAKLLPPETLLVAMYGSIGKLGITTEPCATNQAIAFCKPHAGFNLNYLFYLLMGQRHRLLEQGQGGTQLNISQTILKAHEVSIAPSAEQKRIVSKLDELFSRIDEGERALERVSMLVERYRQSVLKAAVTGELTRAWREKNKDTLESGEALLARILKARREAWEKAELGKLKAKGITRANDSWKKKYQEPASPDTTDLPALPTGWVWASLDMLADVVGGITVDQKRSIEECESVPYLRVANVQRGYLDLSEVKWIGAPRERIEQIRLQPGDILFNEGGDIDKLGRGWIWEGQLPNCIHQNHVFRARLFVAYALNKIISWYGNVLGRTLFMRLGKQTTNLASLSLTKLKSFPVPVMCPREADEIVSRVDDILSITDHQASVIERQMRGSSSLRQGVLKAAFSGRLVNQDPAYEPASTLLERIVPEPGTDNPAPKRGRKKKAAA